MAWLHQSCLQNLDIKTRGGISTHCKTIIPKCVACRWGSIGDVETYLLARGVSNIITVLPEAFGIRTRRETLKLSFFLKGNYY